MIDRSPNHLGHPLASIAEPLVAAPVPIIVDPDGQTRGAVRPAPLRREGPDKLTGRAIYVDDLVVPGAWYGTTIRSTEAHARFLGLDLGLDFDWSQVVVVTAADIPGENVIAAIQSDQPVLVTDEIRHHAEAVALIAAPDRDVLRAARHAVRLRTESLPPVLDPLASDHEFAHYEVGIGDVDAAMTTADLVIEGTYRVGHQEQLYIENQGIIAAPRDDGGVTVHGSLQCPYYVHPALKRALALTDSQAVVIQTETGGGFGGKEEYPSIVAVHAALLARKSGHPVRMIYDRHEDIAATTKRHPAIVHYRTGVMRDGTLVAQDVDVVMDGGAYCTLTPVVLSRGVLHAGGPYRCPDVRIRGRAMATNTPPNGAFRGFGAPQTEFAAEMQANRVADALGVSPLALRRRWVYQLGDMTPTQQILRESVAGQEVLDRAAEAAEFERTRLRTAIGRAGGAAGRAVTSGLRHRAGPGLARRRLHRQWRGQAQERRPPGPRRGWTPGHPDGLHGDGPGDEDHLPATGRRRAGYRGGRRGPGRRGHLYGSRTAARPWRRERPWSSVVSSSRQPDGSGSRSRTATGRPFSASAADYARDHGPVHIEQRFEPYPGIHFDDATYTGDAYPCFGWAAAVAEVDVDLDTGEVAVRSVVAVDDIGRVIHPILAEGQVEGGTLQAVGYATIEEMQLVDGRYRNDRLATYLIPTALDAPRIETILVESPYSGVPHGAKGVGELPMDVGAPAVVAAIHDATGVWIHDLPATPERILAAMRTIP